MDPFTTVDVERVADLLLAREHQLRDAIRSELLRSGEERYLDLAGRVHDLGDESVADMLTDLENTLVERRLRELREVEDARARLGAGTINRCAKCGGDIGLERLLANPVAVRCVICQGDRERKHAHDAMPKL